MTAKTLRAGSIGERAVEFVRATEGRVTGAMLADELDISISEVGMQLSYIVKMGFLELVRGPSRAEDVYVLGVTAKSALQETLQALRDGPAEASETAPVATVAESNPGRLTVLGPNDRPVWVGVDPGSPEGDRTVHAVIEFAGAEPADLMAVVPVDDLSIAIFDDGRMLLEVNGTALMFAPERVAQLVTFLDGFELPRTA
jgi:hypothetical protein